MKKFFAIALILALTLGLAAFAESSVDLSEVLAEFNLGEEMMVLDLTDLVNIYYFDEADVKQCAAAIHTSGINCDEIMLFEATDADAADRIKLMLDERYQSKLNETENYLPEEYAIIKTCSVTQNGNFVAMIVAPNAAELTEIYNKHFQ